MMKRHIAAVLLPVLLYTSPATAEDACRAPEPVCAARGAVFAISSFDPFASAVRIGDDLLVTTRHSVADEATVTITRKDGTKLTGTVRPTGHDIDLILIDAEGLAPGAVLAAGGTADAGTTLYTVGGDAGGKRVRVYPKGRVLLKPSGETAYGRLHHTAYSQPGNSGGALVDETGRLVGIVASGGEGRYEAIPARELARLKELSGPEFADQSAALGGAVRRCVELLEQRSRGLVPKDWADGLFTACSTSGNRQLYDIAAQVLSRGRQPALAVKISELSVARDPNALNTRLTLLTILHIARRFEDELPHVRFLLEHLPGEPMVHRFAIQAGKWADAPDLVEKGLELIKQHNPAQLKAAQGFLDANIPRPKLQAQ
ncbi:MAG: S1 family peptidase [Hyphomicrobiales bacterium]